MGADRGTDGRATAGSRRLTGGLIGLAGLAGLASAGLGWARLVYPTAEPGLATVSVGHPRIGLFLGLFMIAAGLVVVAIGSPEATRAWATVGIACGLVMGAFAILDLLGERRRAVDALIDQAARSGQGTVSQLRGRLAPVIEFSFRPGIYLAVAAAALALAAGIVMLLRNPSEQRRGPGVTH